MPVAILRFPNRAPEDAACLPTRPSADLYRARRGKVRCARQLADQGVVKLASSARRLASFGETFFARVKAAFAFAVSPAER